MLLVNNVHTICLHKARSEEPIFNKFSKNIYSVSNRHSGEAGQTYFTSTDKEILMSSTLFFPASRY